MTKELNYKLYYYSETQDEEGMRNVIDAIKAYKPKSKLKVPKELKDLYVEVFL